MAAERVDGSDFFAVKAAMGRALDRARCGGGPGTIEAMTTRFYGHFEGDPQKYRAQDEVARHRATMDCLARFRASVALSGSVSSKELDAIDEEVLEQIDAAVRAARAAPSPPESELTTDVYISY
jgi:acetoin:2,6-dichlorophenolindophenol oxidoreductase subunit alpha